MMFLVFLVALTPVSCRDLMDKILSSKTWQSKHIFRFGIWDGVQNLSTELHIPKIIPTYGKVPT